MARPRVADVQCSRLAFQPGDRVIVRVYERLCKDEKRKLQRSVERWAGVGIEVLIVDATRMEVSIVRAENAIIRG